MPFRILREIAKVVEEVADVVVEDVVKAIEDKTQAVEDKTQAIQQQAFDTLQKEHNEIKAAYEAEIDKIKTLIDQKLTATILSPRSLEIQKQIDAKEQQIKKLEHKNDRDDPPPLVKPPQGLASLKQPPLIKKKGTNVITKSIYQPADHPKWK
jgi:hypothetical protein